MRGTAAESSSTTTPSRLGCAARARGRLHYRLRDWGATARISFLNSAAGAEPANEENEWAMICPRSQPIATRSESPASPEHQSPDLAGHLPITERRYSHSTVNMNGADKIPPGFTITISCLPGASIMGFRTNDPSLTIADV